MADPASGGAADPAATPSGAPLLFYLAIGRLASNREGELLPEKHRLVAHNFGRKGDPDPDWAKSIKSHLKAVMKRAGHKLAPGKRIRLKDDAGNYEVHILTDEAEGDRTKTLVFFGRKGSEGHRGRVLQCVQQGACRTLCSPSLVCVRVL